MPRFASPRTCLALLLATPAPAIAATSESQAWISESVTMTAGSATIVTLDGSQRARPDRAGGGQVQMRLTLDHRLAPAFQIGGGILYATSAAEQELRLFQQVTATSGIWLARTRLEQRFFDNAGQPGWRLRQRVQASVPLDAAEKWTLIAATEMFFHLNRARPNDKGGLASIRNQVGVRHGITRAIDVQLLYMRQQNFRDGRADAVAHIPWLTMSWRI